ncbi:MULTISPECIES: non-ribosomal peptide synthetase [unclassified Pseudomonas]|uniref:non-ribosomal peptide synthetase n=1 Tax=unclassified Pseudomonas TaxID=196821 RepID=UPI00216077F3|nr:amino acid adenylation domain-containing protein [Pseudomonas sp. B21-015]UVM49100.1 amino acid adenylation domain-containing protein [Pseudomonas sp. B21-015]
MVEIDLPSTAQARVSSQRFMSRNAETIANSHSLIQRFNEVTRLYGNATAVVTQSECWTYRELSDRAARIAGLITSVCGEGNEPVALLFPHGAPMVAAILGVLGAGKFYVPLVADDPLPRLQTILRESRCRAVFVSCELAELGGQLGSGAMVIEEASLPVEGGSLDTRSGDSIAYLLYTSGTTGVPKGVFQNDRNVLHHAACYASAIELTANDRMTLLPFYGFDASVMDIFATLLTGASLYIWNVRKDGLERVNDWLADSQITVWHSTPSVLRAAFPTFKRTVDLRWVVLGGETATGQDLSLTLLHAGAHCSLLNGLGPTECTTALQYVADPIQDCNLLRLPVGRPVPGIEVVLLDADGNSSATEGELAIISQYVALGYWERQDLTHERFGELAGPNGERCYRTGDMVKWNAAGNLEYLTRVDDQIKIRGFRVELGEIQATLCMHENVLQAVVLPHTDPATQQQSIIAYVVLRAPDSTDVTARFRVYLASSLPSYMIPQTFVELCAIPLLPNGKVNRSALPIAAVTDTAYEPKRPQTPLQRLLVGLWSTVLRRDALGTDENFFELGGDSLLGVRLLARINASLELELGLSDLFGHPTVESLAVHLSIPSR